MHHFIFRESTVSADHIRNMEGGRVERIQVQLVICVSL